MLGAYKAFASPSMGEAAARSDAGEGGAPLTRPTAAADLSHRGRGGIRARNARSSLLIHAIV